MDTAIATARPASSGEAGAVPPGLSYVTDQEPGIRRRRAGRGFSYSWPDGSRLTEKATLERIRRLAIPPAYRDVWIAPDPNGHIQATGRDAKGRKQYRYHPDWTGQRGATKFDRLLVFAELLPRLRAAIRREMAGRHLSRGTVLATVVNLLETTLIRIGNDDYARQNNSYGLTTLRPDHVSVIGSAELLFRFDGKSGKTWRLRVRDRRVARVIRSCQELPGQALFKYFDEDGSVARITSSDVNEFLREHSGAEITAKEFRTWAATVMAVDLLAGLPPPETKSEAKKEIKTALEAIARRLGNTPSVCRKSYVHPAVMEHYAAGTLPALAQPESGPDGLSSAEERALVAFLKAIGEPSAGGTPVRGA